MEESNGMGILEFPGSLYGNSSKQTGIAATLYLGCSNVTWNELSLWYVERYMCNLHFEPSGLRYASSFQL